MFFSEFFAAFDFEVLLVLVLCLKKDDANFTLKFLIRNCITDIVNLSVTVRTLKLADNT